MYVCIHTAEPARLHIEAELAALAGLGVHPPLPLPRLAPRRPQLRLPPCREGQTRALRVARAWCVRGACVACAWCAVLVVWCVRGAYN